MKRNITTLMLLAVMYVALNAGCGPPHRLAPPPPPPAPPAPPAASR